MGSRLSSARLQRCSSTPEQGGEAGSWKPCAQLPATCAGQWDAPGPPWLGAGPGSVGLCRHWGPQGGALVGGWVLWAGPRCSHLALPAWSPEAWLHRATGAVGWVLSPRGCQEQLPHGGCMVSSRDVVLCWGRHDRGHVSPPALCRRQLLGKCATALAMTVRQTSRCLKVGVRRKPPRVHGRGPQHAWAPCSGAGWRRAALGVVCCTLRPGHRL